jgi:hypothetical protein
VTLAEAQRHRPGRVVLVVTYSGRTVALRRTRLFSRARKPPMPTVATRDETALMTRIVVISGPFLDETGCRHVMKGNRREPHNSVRNGTKLARSRGQAGAAVIPARRLRLGGVAREDPGPEADVFALVTDARFEREPDLPGNVGENGSLLVRL